MQIRVLHICEIFSKAFNNFRETTILVSLHFKPTLYTAVLGSTPFSLDVEVNVSHESAYQHVEHMLQ